MKVVVIGGTGLIGSKVVARLGEHGHEAVAAAPGTGVDTITGKGLAEALTGADVVVDVSNSPSFAADAVLTFFETSTRNLLAAATAAGVRHYVALSVVGTGRLQQSGYFRPGETRRPADGGHRPVGEVLRRRPGRGHAGPGGRCAARRDDLPAVQGPLNRSVAAPAEEVDPGRRTVGVGDDVRPTPAAEPVQPFAESLLDGG